MRCMSMGGLGGDLPLTLEINTRCLRRPDLLLLQDEGFALIVRLDERGRYQHSPHPEETYPYPDVHRLAVPAHQHLLRSTNLLARGVVDCVTGAPLPEGYASSIAFSISLASALTSFFISFLARLVASSTARSTVTSPTRIKGGKIRPIAAPTARPAQPPCWVGFSVLSTIFTLPFSFLVRTAAS